MGITVISPSRLACCLIDLNGSRGRIDGCLGITLQKPQIRVHVQKVTDKIQVIWPGNEVKVLEEVTQRIKDDLKIQGGAIIQVQECYPAHCGLGRNTQLYLSVAAGLAAIYKRKMATRELATLLQRGGTSGAGVAAFEGGGVILDGGHTFGEGKEKQSFLPSSRSQASPALLLARYPFPQNWRLVCIRVENIRGKSGEEEVEFFRHHCPVNASDVADTSWILLMQLLPSLITRDLKTFNTAIESLQLLGFKKAIWQSLPTEVHIVTQIMQDIGIPGIGLSSFGPTLYCATNEREAHTVASVVHNALRKKAIHATVWSTRGRNSGARFYSS